MVSDPFLNNGVFIENFDGNPTKSFTKWSEKFLDVLSLVTTPLTEQQKLVRLRFYLSGQARNTFDMMIPAPLNLSGAINYLKTKFENVNTKIIARQKLSNCRQASGESVFDFANRLTDLVRTAYVGENEHTIQNTLLYEFLDRLEPELKFQVKSQRPAEYTIAYELALNFELLLAEKRSATSIYTSELKDEFEALSFQRKGNTKTCFNCRSPNHLVRDCPEKKSGNSRGKQTCRSRAYYNSRYGNRNKNDQRLENENINKEYNYSYTRYRDYNGDNRSWRRTSKEDYDNLSDSSSSRSSSRESSKFGLNRELSPQFRRGSTRIWATSPEY
uniref:CCHC-type domain-containing protein n=1 Tax=Meloidogyne incognita TaxID=6306 RepID=A0A914NMU7_MELIC